MISKEGININISQEYELLEKAIQNISKVIDLDDVHVNRTESNGIEFQKLKVKIKAENVLVKSKSFLPPSLVFYPIFLALKFAQIFFMFTARICSTFDVTKVGLKNS